MSQTDSEAPAVLFLIILKLHNLFVWEFLMGASVGGRGVAFTLIVNIEHIAPCESII